MKPVRQGDRGVAVEDIQKRLLAMDLDIGPTGVDGVFLGTTLEAVRRFQSDMGLSEDGVVGPQTWAALVDATFTLGDRLLYLRHPYLHGADVRRLQRILNTLGFACGEPDGIFGAFTERAVREFQRNVGDPADGIAGAETVRALLNLRHVWEGKDPSSPVTCTVAPARAAQALEGPVIVVRYSGEVASDVARRVENLARAVQPNAKVAIEEGPDGGSGDADVTLILIDRPVDTLADGIPVVLVQDDPTEGLAPRLVTAMSSGSTKRLTVVVVLGETAGETERERQSVAVGLLDGLCAGLG